MKKLIITISFLISILSVEAQSDTLSIVINDIDIMGNPSQATLAIGSRISSMRSSVMEASKSLSLSELLTENSVVYIKSYGQGALSTSSFRGTNSSHTAVNWNGININPSMSGSFDFSKIPVFFVDDITLRHGSGGTSSGSGALGGSIYISNSPNWSDNHKVKAFFEGGSFSTYTAAVGVNIKKERSLHRSRVYYTSSENDFRYLNKVFSTEPTYERRAESKYLSTAFMQEDYFKIKGGTLSSNLWLSYGDRQLPQPITLYVTKHEKDKSGSLKYSLKYDKSYGKHYYEITGGYLFDLMNYTKSYDRSPEVVSNRNLSHRFVAKGLYQYDLKSNLLVGATLSYTLDHIAAENYTTNGVTRNTALVNGYAIWKPSRKFETTAEATLDITDSKAGGLLSFGMATPLIENMMKLSQSISYNRRFPSLNDLYWTPGGNPNLKPEKGLSYDVTLSATPSLGEVSLRLDATYYVMNINDWIVWLPTDSYYWAPKNMKRVVSQGLELMSEVGFLTGSYRHRITANYTLSSSQNREAASESDNSVGKQLPYIPKHKFNVRYSGSWKGLNWSFSTYYTSQRYTTTDNSYSTVGYTICDAEASYSIKTKGKLTLTPRIRVNNLFDAYYESIQYYPMPLRSISAGITLTY